MLFWPSPREGLAWLEADDEAWAQRAAAAYAAATERGQAPAEGGQAPAEGGSAC